MTSLDELTWMVVEDDHAIRDVLVTLCDLWDNEIITFKDGFEAKAYIEQEVLPDPLPDIALIDIRMPGPWGHEISAKLRDHPKLKNMGIILMTAYALPGEDKDAYLETSGADKLLYKPLPPMDELRQEVEDILKKRSSSKEDEKPTPEA